MKKIISLLLAAVWIFSAAGCGDQTAPGATTEPSVYEAAQTQETALPPETAAEPETMPPEPEPIVEPETEPSLPPQPEPEDEMFVSVLQYIPDAAIELKYASGDNFTGTVIYDFDQCFLRYGTVKKLMAVQAQLAEMGLGIKIWDGFRPVSAQYCLWEVCPDPAFVANPQTGYSSHSRGNTVDLTIVDSTGAELAMPTGFDDFSSLADRNYSDCAPIAAQNARLLQEVMEEAGFTGYYNEWWHFSDTVTYPAEEDFQPLPVSWYYADCEEFITLRTRPDTAAAEILRIPVLGEFQVIASWNEFYYVNYMGLYGFVLASYCASVEA